MMRLWLSRGMEVPMQEQLTAQIVLGILSRQLTPGERLPSVRALARRLEIHPNTVSAVYRNLVERGWVTIRQGSGVYVRPMVIPERNGEVVSSDLFVQHFLDEGLALGFSLEDLNQAWRKATGQLRSQCFLVADPDVRLAEIMASEIGEALHSEVSFCALEKGGLDVDSSTCVLVTDFSAPRLLRSQKHINSRTIRLKSMQDSISGQSRPSAPILIAVVSRSESVLRWSGTLLSALGFATESVLLRNPCHAEWQNGLASCGIVAADVVAARELPESITPLIFKTVADDFIAEMRGLKNTPTGRGK